MTFRIDHIAIGANTLAGGVDALKDVLGVEVPSGGKHEAMSTHNCVMQTGDETFLEIIAIDPDAPDPGRARWFTLDDPATQRRLAAGPRALAWVVNTDDLDAVVASSPVDLGEIVPLSRAGRNWRITVPADGHLPEAGLLPVFIEWSPGPHPSAAQQDLGVRLQKVVLTHPEPARLSEMLTALGIRDLAEVKEGERGLSFVIETGQGAVTLV